MTVKTYLESLKQSGIDTLILGCTHYPLLKKAIGKFLGGGVHLVDSAEETAREVRAMLKRAWLARQRGNGSHGFFVTDAHERFIKVGRRFLGERVESAGTNRALRRAAGFSCEALSCQPNHVF